MSKKHLFGGQSGQTAMRATTSDRDLLICKEKLERAKGFEPSTSTLAGGGFRQT